MKKQQVKQNKRLKIICLSIVGFVVIYSIISLIAGKFIYDSQFPRYDRHDETVSAGLRYQDLKDDYPRRLVSFQSGNNVLQGYMYGLDQEQGLVVVVHGIGGGADSYLPQITYFVDQGWRVFAYDATGSFDSEGKTTKGFPQALIDLDAALTYINTEPELNDLPLLLFGHSWGGYAVANVLHYNHDIAGVVTVSGVNSPMDIVIEQGHHLTGSFINIQYPFLWLYQRFLFGNAASLNAVDGINKSDVPVLIIHGTEDESVVYNGASIIAKKDAITNPNVRFMPMSEPMRNGHNNLFRSDAALNYVDEVNTVYRELYDRYEQNIPYEVRQDFYANIDRRLAQELNLGLMGSIQEFFLECLNDEQLI